MNFSFLIEHIPSLMLLSFLVVIIGVNLLPADKSEYQE